MWWLGRNRLLLPFLLLLLPQENQATDGCGKEGGGWRCGDVCTTFLYNPYTFTYDRHTCNCNGESFGPHDGKWCCEGTNSTVSGGVQIPYTELGIVLSGHQASAPLASPST